jgi:hypothetical protein
MFRKTPPLEVVETVLRCFKLNGLSDKRWFSKEDIPLDTLEQWLPLVEPFYLPCKAERYLHGQMTHQRMITVLRHLLKQHAIELKVQERMISGQKTTLYQVFYDHIDPIVRFD